MEIILEEDRNLHKVIPGFFFSFIMLFVMKVLFLCFHWWMTLNNVVCWIRLLLPWIGNNCSDLLPVQIFICKFLLNKTNANKTFFTVCQKEGWRIFFVIYCMNIRMRLFSTCIIESIPVCTFFPEANCVKN